MTRLTSSAFVSVAATIVLTLIMNADGAAVTIYGVEPFTISTPANAPLPATPYSYQTAGTEVYSAVTTLESGVTRYQVQNIQSLLVAHKTDTTETLISTPTTVTYTVEQGGAIHRQYNDPALSIVLASDGLSIDWKKSHQRIGVQQECQMDADKKKAVCVDEWRVPMLTPSVSGTQTVGATVTDTFTTTYTGNLLPVATLQSGARGLVTGGSAAFMMLTVVLGAFMA